MRKALLGAAAAATVLAAGGCYKDFDLDADNKADFAYIDANGDWWNANTGAVIYDGQPGDIAVPEDYDGDDNWDIAVVRGGDWITATGLTISFPAPPQLPEFVTADPFDYHVLPVPGDYDGDGAAEPAWYRDTDGTWFIQDVGTIVFGSGPPVAEWGVTTDQDFPVPADYDGDGTTDLATFNAVTREWKVKSLVDGTESTVTMDANVFRPLPVAGDFDLDGAAERVTVGADGWEIEGGGAPIDFGSSDLLLPALADYVGDGNLDLSYFGWDGTWYTQGGTTDFPLFNPDEPQAAYPIPTGYNLVMNMYRLNLSGRCDLFVQFCT